MSQYPKIAGYPHLFVLESNDDFLHSQGTGELEEGQGDNKQVYVDFLETWKPSPQRDARPR